MARKKAKSLKKLQDLTLMDRFLFNEVMEDKDAYQAAIGILLEKEIWLLEKPETEKELRVSPELREVRLDVVSMDTQNKVFYTEVQKKDTGNLEKRSRFYQAQMDVSLLEPGSRDFNQLNDSCLILIAPFDIFGHSLCRYTFEGACKECPDLRIGDGAIRVFINTKGKNRKAFSKEFQDFLEYMEKPTDEAAAKSKSDRIRIIHESVKKIRLSEKMGVKYMQWWEEKAYAREEGYEEGEEKRLIRTVCKKLKKQKSLEEIADAVEESIELVTKISDVAEAFAPDYDCDEIYKKLHEGAEDGIF